MLNDRLNAARQIKAAIDPAEASLGASLAHACALLATLPEARATAKVSPIVGHEVIEAALAGVTGIVSAMGSLVRAHQLLGEQAEARGITPRMIGGGDDKNPNPSVYAWPAAELPAVSEVA